ncbi:MAG: hypothetical protein JWQ16_1734 [Novosphingobium sp.]|nr:hypothetical protein [Novosphingobium sp.]
MIILWIYLAIAAIVALHRAATIGGDWTNYRRGLEAIVADMGDSDLDQVFRAVAKNLCLYCLVIGLAWPVLVGAAVFGVGRK